MIDASGAFYSSLPRVRVGSGALITDERDRVLIVEPTYKDHWEVPGGIVESGETPVTAVERELHEELGIQITIGPLLVIEYQTDLGPRGDSIMFVYDGGSLTDPGQLHLAAKELRSFAFVPRQELAMKLTPKLARRLESAMDARASGRMIELENGVPRLVRTAGGEPGSDP